MSVLPKDPFEFHADTERIPPSLTARQLLADPDRTGTFFRTGFQRPDTEHLPHLWRDLMPGELHFHMHEFCQITQLVEGHALYLINNQPVEVQAGDILIISPNTLHSWLAVENTVSFFVTFRPSQLRPDGRMAHYEDKLTLLTSAQHPYTLIQTSQEDHPAFSRILDDIRTENRQRLPGYDLLVHNLLQRLTLLQLRRTFTPDDQPVNDHGSHCVKQALAYISSHLDTLTGVTQVAEHVHMNPNYFSHHFKASLGVSFTKYVALERLTRAAVLLRTTDRDVLDIALECGFKSSSSFYRQFTGLYAVSPAKFRKLLDRS